MQLNPSEISDLIKKKIEGFDLGAEAHTEGTVVSVTDGIVRIHGLSEAMQGEMLEFPGNTFGLALNLERDSVGAVVLGEYEHITEGDTVKCTGRILEVPVGPELIGRVVNALGEPIDGKGPIEAKLTDKIEKVAPGVIWRKSVSQPVQTGLKSVDSMVPNTMLFELLQQPIPGCPTDEQILMAALHFYDLRGGGLETQNRNDKQGLGLSRRNKHRFADQEMLVLLAELAHNLIIWTRNDLANTNALPQVWHPTNRS